MFRLSFMFIALLTAGCVSLDPHYDRPAAPVPATLPGAHGESTAVVGDWQKVVNDARLKKVVSIALNSNRDVQKALADIEAARGDALVWALERGSRSGRVAWQFARDWGGKHGKPFVADPATDSGSKA